MANQTAFVACTVMEPYASTVKRVAHGPQASVINPLFRSELAVVAFIRKKLNSTELP